MEAILASPLLAGLQASPAGPGRRRERVARADRFEAEAISERSTMASASARSTAAWAGLQGGDLDDRCSEPSTQAPGYFSGALASDGSSGASDSLAVGRHDSRGSAQLWSGSMLTQGLMLAVPEESGSMLAQGLAQDELFLPATSPFTHSSASRQSALLRHGEIRCVRL
ncbi:unnamed protein product [Prorocentrum cordatum]|uniref:Uncharacterized protein n=1 Tax=Prorocentrum cordatum TaxID=2364126 RepID=A0ABN9VE71_9DINO|nr:unnamed protein product [Polarella glacialis]